MSIKRPDDLRGVILAPDIVGAGTSDPDNTCFICHHIRPDGAWAKQRITGVAFFICKACCYALEEVTGDSGLMPAHWNMP